MVTEITGKLTILKLRWDICSCKSNQKISGADLIILRHTDKFAVITYFTGFLPNKGPKGSTNITGDKRSKRRS